MNKEKMKSRFVLCTMILTFTLTLRVWGQSPELINFQAQLEGMDTGTASVTFTIYDAISGGANLWSETYPNLSVVAGRIQVLLGTNSAIGDLFETAGERYLEITVNGETLSPRSQLTSVAYALRAAVADQLAGGGTGGGGVSSLNTLTGDVVLTEGTNISITPDGQNLRIDAASGGSGITTINAGAGISVSDSDGPITEIALQADAITDAYIADNSLTDISLADNAVGSDELKANIVLGGNGRLDIQNPGGQIRASLYTVNSAGFLGLNQADDDDAVTLETQGGGYGMITAHNAEGLNGSRMWGELTGSDSDTGVQLRGGSMALFKKNGANSSIWMRTNGTADDNAWGVLTLDNAANNPTITMTGQNGDITIAGNLAKGSGSFKIDHPLDPTNKYLSHSFVESPDMMNIYNGNVVLDSNGQAEVELPEWFEALNTEFRYQLTCIGGFANVYVAEEISENRFKIAGGTPGLKVSWMVTGIRNDPYAQSRRIKVEEEKPASERGKYMHPGAYGVSNN